MFPGVISIKICPSSWSRSQSPRHLHLSHKRAQRDQRCYKRDVLVLDCSKSLTRKDLSEDHNQRQWCHILIVTLGLSLAYMQMIHSGNNQVAWSCFHVPVPVPFHIHFGSSHCWPLDVPSHVFSSLLSPVLSVVFNINRDLLLLILIPDSSPYILSPRRTHEWTFLLVYLSFFSSSSFRIKTNTTEFT